MIGEELSRRKVVGGFLSVITVGFAGCGGERGSSDSSNSMTPNDVSPSPETTTTKAGVNSNQTKTIAGGPAEKPPGLPSIDNSNKTYKWSENTPDFIANNESAQEYCSSDSVNQENYRAYCEVIDQ